MVNICVTPACGLPSTLRCPTCLELGITNSFFCSQKCFKQFWKTHKMLHLAAVNSAPTNSASDETFAGHVFTGPLRPFGKTPTRTLPTSIQRPDYSDSGIPHSERQAKGSHVILTLDDSEIECMRVTSKLAREVLEEAVNAVQVGVTTDEIDRVVHEASVVCIELYSRVARACVERDCYPSPLNYFNFPKSCCTSINEVICHGIPDLRPLQDGDILNIDITTYHDGFHGDVNETVFVGKPDDRAVRLVKNSYNCLAKAMDAVRPGVKYREIGDIITKQASADGFSVVRTYSGHGIHRLFHCPPNVPHYSRNKAVGVMKPGHCFTIEPMINEGVWRDELWPDKWTAVTVDGMRSAQFEHTMVILSPERSTSTGLPIEVLTKRQLKGEDPLPSTIRSAFSADDQLHFERYGRPYFVDQLHQFNMDNWITV
ncbi:Methionine aminopeptidase [Paragonimus heterotremus]|uniref:Methionine aminopeptidase n=1 Tax=Paragonimus heterotremus TaxID=100268 RepID=A0A8J4TGG8_9TREM|nr:Methionine aminopeptidase [Paragonimus heterotremus]